MSSFHILLICIVVLFNRICAQSYSQVRLAVQPSGSFYYTHSDDNGKLTIDHNVENLDTKIKNFSDGMFSGSYEYQGQNGVNYRVTYVKDKNGYRSESEPSLALPQPAYSPAFEVINIDPNALKSLIGK